MVQKSIKYGQNFIIYRKAVIDLIKKTTLSNKDIVYEIGTGQGIVTRELCQHCKQVISFEIDECLYRRSKRFFRTRKNVQIFHRDFLSATLPKSNYKVFASIPFNITTQIMRKLFTHGYSPEETYLVMEKGAALRFMGNPMTRFVAQSIYPQVQAKLVANLSRLIFRPIPNVEIVFLKITRRSSALVSQMEWQNYKRYIQTLFNGKKKNARSNLKGRFKYPEWKRLARSLNFDLDVKPSELQGEQILKLFKYLQNRTHKL